MPPSIDILLSNAGFVLGEGEDFYGVWSRAEGEPLARFPKTDDGFEAAVDHYERQSRVRRWGGDAPSVVLFGLLAAALFVWIVAGAIETVKTSGIGYFPTRPPTWVNDVVIAQAIAFRVWVSCLAALIAIGIIRYVAQRNAD